MNEKLKALEVSRQEIVKAYKKHSLSGIIVLIAAILLGVAGMTTEVMALVGAAVIALIASIVFFVKANAQAVKYRNIIKKDLILMLLNEEFDDVGYEPKSHIPVSRINSTGTIRQPDRYSGEDYIKGTYKGVKFEVSDIDLKQRVETRDSKGNVQVSYQTYFKGRWYIYQYPKHFKEVLKIVEGRGSYVNKKNLVKFETESMAFNKKFDIFSSSKEFGFYLITSSMLEKLLELEALHRGSIVYCYQGNELHIGINDSKDYMEFKLKTPITEENLKIFMSDIELISAIVNEFKLDSSKFK